MTIGFWVLVGTIALCGLAVAIWLFCDKWSDWSDHNVRNGLIALLITAIVVSGTIGVGYWYYNNTARGVRAMKDQQSELNNGLMREITITAEDGREIFHYKGKCDIETSNGYILFEGEDGLRRMIYYGALDTIIVVELETQ